MIKNIKYKVERGKKIYEKVGNYGIKEESLCPEYKEMLDMYMKQRENIDIDNVILRLWQTSLLEYMKPSYREVIWVIGKKGRAIAALGFRPPLLITVSSAVGSCL